MLLDLAFADLLPGIVVIGLLALCGTLREGLARLCVPALVAGLLAYYFHWRIGHTLDGPGIGDADRVFILAFLLVEILGALDALLLLLILTRRRDNSAAADRFAEASRSTPPERLPPVDVFIPTYNEPPEVLERSIFAALAMDWPGLRVWVLDDGRRDWLRAFCARHGAGYLTRADNREAKAGNINAALPRTEAPFIAIFDADFAPRRDFLRRTMGFFEDPRVGIVQTPHHFFNPDPIQQNLALSGAIPDEQRFFFDVIMPARDAWDVAFCCGSNSVTRRSALAAVGGGLPAGSITEDMHLTLVLLRQGFVTRYLAEPLALGLAPESTDAYFVQRARWARGAIQMLFLPTGPLGPGLSLFRRLAFLPSHWLVGGLVQAMSLLAPLVFLWTGLVPIANITAVDVLRYQAPVLAGVVGAFAVLSRGTFQPLESALVNAFSVFRLLPAVLASLVRPFGQGFKVTPKGNAARVGAGDRLILAAAAAIILLLLGGIAVNAFPDTRIVAREALIPVVAFWAVVNTVLLLLVAVVATGRPAQRLEERFDMEGEAATLVLDGEERSVRLLDLSLSGARIACELPPPAGATVRLQIRGVPDLACRLARSAGGEAGMTFLDADETVRQALVQRLFSDGRRPSVAFSDRPGTALQLLSRILLPDPPKRAAGVRG
jgi:cellulose synthase (UDP-forming)